MNQTVRHLKKWRKWNLTKNIFGCLVSNPVSLTSLANNALLSCFIFLWFFKPEKAHTPPSPPAFVVLEQRIVDLFYKLWNQKKIKRYYKEFILLYQILIFVIWCAKRPLSFFDRNQICLKKKWYKAYLFLRMLANHSKPSYKPSPEVAQVAWLNQFLLRMACKPSRSVTSATKRQNY